MRVTSWRNRVSPLAILDHREGRDVTCGLGARVRAAALDVSSRNQVAAALRDIEATLPPLAGVVHAAGEIDGEGDTTAKK